MTLKIGVIGTGAIGQEHIERLHNKLVGSTVVAVNDINPTQAEMVANRLTPAAHVHATGQEVIGDPNVDAVVVTSWGPTHEEFVLASIAAGKPVYVEKPMALDHAECEAIIRAGCEANVPVFVAYYRRALPRFLKIRDLLAEGAIGAPRLASVVFHDPFAPVRLDLS